MLNTKIRKSQLLAPSEGRRMKISPKQRRVILYYALEVMEKEKKKKNVHREVLEQMNRSLNDANQADNQEVTAQVVSQAELDVLAKAESLTGRKIDHAREKSAVKKEVQRGIELNAAIMHMGEKGNDIKEMISSSQLVNPYDVDKINHHMKKQDEKYGQKKLERKKRKYLNKEIYRNVGMRDAAMTVMVSESISDKKQTITEIKGVSGNTPKDGLKTKERQLGIKSARDINKQIRVFQKQGVNRESINEFQKKQDRIIGKKQHHLEKRTEKRGKKADTKSQLRSARMKFVIGTIVGKEQEDKSAGVELMKKVFEIRARNVAGSVGKKVTFVLGKLLFILLQPFIVLFTTIWTILLSLMIPLMVAALCVGTVYSAIAYLGGFFDFGNGSGGIVKVSSAEVNIKERANELYKDFNTTISTYTSQGRVTKDNKTQYEKTEYKVFYPQNSKPAKGDLLTSYFASIADSKDVSEDDLLPYLNVNTVTEKMVLRNVFDAMNYMGEESKEQTSETRLIGYEQKEIKQIVLTGYNTTYTENSVEVGGGIQITGVSYSTSGSCYVKLDTETNFKKVSQLGVADMRADTLYCYLYTTSFNKIPLGSVLTLDYKYKENGKEITVPFKVQVIGIDASGSNLYKNNNYIKIFTKSRNNAGNIRDINKALNNINKDKNEAVRFTNLCSQTAYTYQTAHTEPVYEERTSWVDDLDKPIYKTYTYITYSKPVYYLDASSWYENHKSGLSENQKSIYELCRELYSGIDY